MIETNHDVLMVRGSDGNLHPITSIKGDKGDRGSDANVTKANVESALGYSPVAPTDYAEQDTDKAGVVKLTSAFGLNSWNGNMYAVTKNEEAFDSDIDACFVAKGTLNNVLFNRFIGHYDVTWTAGGYIHKDDGTVKSEDGSSYSDFVSVEPGSKLLFRNTMTTDTEWNVFYDSEKNYVSSFSNASGVITVPDNARYIRLSKHTADTVTVTIGDVLSRINGLKNDLKLETDWLYEKTVDNKNAIDEISKTYDKYTGKLIHIANCQNGVAELIKFDSSLVGHTVTSCGKNLFNINGDVDIDLSTGLERPGYVTVSNGVLTTQLYSSTYHPNGQRLYNMKGKTISISANCISTDVSGYIGIYENGDEKAYKTGQGIIKVENYVCQTDTPIVGLITSGSSGGAQFKDIQVEIGEAKTDFETYKSDTFSVTSESDEYTLKTYAEVTNIYNDCGASMTFLTNKTSSKLAGEVSEIKEDIVNKQDKITEDNKLSYNLLKDTPSVVPKLLYSWKCTWDWFDYVVPLVGYDSETNTWETDGSVDLTKLPDYSMYGLNGPYAILIPAKDDFIESNINSYKIPITMTNANARNDEIKIKDYATDSNHFSHDYYKLPSGKSASDYVLAIKIRNGGFGALSPEFVVKRSIFGDYDNYKFIVTSGSECAPSAENCPFGIFKSDFGGLFFKTPIKCRMAQWGSNIRSMTTIVMRRMEGENYFGYINTSRITTGRWGYDSGNVTADNIVGTIHKLPWKGESYNSNISLATNRETIIPTPDSSIQIWGWNNE